MMMFSRGLFLFLVMAIARSPSDRFNTFAWGWVTGPSTSNKNQNPLVSRMIPCKLPSVSVPSTTTWLCGNNKKNSAGGGNSCLHSSVVSPRKADVGGSIDDDDYEFDYEFDGGNHEEDLQMQQEKLSQLCNLLQAEPKDLLRFENDDSSGVRGMYLNHSVKNGEIILKLPLNSCLTDDRSPSWIHDEVKNDPYRWATRLAASWADLHLKNKLAAGGRKSDDNDHTTQVVDEGHVVWSSLLPDPEYLRASLPVHWPEKTVLNARSTALELAVDSAFFARAEAVDDLVRGFQRSPYAEIFSKNDDNNDDDSKDGMDMNMNMNELAHHALDMIQTRSCRLEEKHVLDGDDNENRVEYRRVLAPIFDFINHGSQNAATGSANAYFALEEEEQQSTESISSSSSNIEKYLVVRSMKDISQDEEVKMDYGGSTRPAWKCLLSYGFVPEYKRTMADADGGENLAEVYMKGVRYEVSDDSVPIDMVADATPLQWLEDEDDQQTNDTTNAIPPEIVLTPDIALRIAGRIADAAYYLLLEPEQILDDTDDSTEALPPTPFEVISKQLAASLRWSQHRILLTSAAGLTQFAKEHTKEEESTCHP